MGIKTIIVSPYGYLVSVKRRLRSYSGQETVLARLGPEWGAGGVVRQKDGASFDSLSRGSLSTGHHETISHARFSSGIVWGEIRHRGSKISTRLVV